ncbi:uncharacterized protein BDV14DRAFT_203233 [Aspergillus stella-maris]|uniref:uncharacterized protein n=1 Tax=Aspergillus stella-maris TaxID=1810926 RepID=UPI003CCDDB5F
MSRSLAGLPLEIISLIASSLSNRDIKTLRLTCRTLCNSVRLRLDRVFLSANPLNIAVFLAIADSEKFQHGIKEIIWDDARFLKSPYDEEEMHPEDQEELWKDDENGCPWWFAKQCEEQIEDLEMRSGSDRNHKEEEVLPLKICWQYYQNLLQQQEDVIIFNKDLDALVYGLPRFPALKRITVTPAAHGWLFAPLYETPMIRSFPRGFNYPTPRGWPTIPDGTYKPKAKPWNDKSVKWDFRGFVLITRVLATYPAHHISQLRISANTLETGLNCRIFEDKNQEYDDLASIMARPGFKRLDLDLLVGGQEHTGWHAFRSRNLYHALTAARDLEYINLSTNTDCDPSSDSVQPGSGGSRAHLVPLQTIFPISSWTSLRHFGLRGLLVDQSNLITFFASLPATLRSIHLSFLYFVDDGGSWQKLLQDMRTKLDWRTRDPESRPVVSVAVATDYQQVGHAVWIDEDVAEFLYGEGPNPFYNGGDAVGCVGVVRDAFAPGKEWAKVPSGR